MPWAHIHWQAPEAFWLLLLLPLLGYDLWSNRGRRRSVIRFPATALARKARPGYTLWVRRALPLLRLVGYACLVVALARPQTGEAQEKVVSEGVDIMLVFDISGSMDMLDLITPAEQAKLGRMNAEQLYKSGEYKKFSRMGYANRVLNEFVKKRSGDRIGLTVFASTAFTMCPLTLDHGVLLELLNSIDENTMDNRGTAIGDGIANGVMRLQESTAKSRVIIMLTDGANNAGEVHPLRAADMARALGIKVYAVGMGRNEGNTLMFRQNPFSGEILWGEGPIPPEHWIDENTMRQIAEKTGGKFFHGKNHEELAQIYDAIDKLERTEIQAWNYTLYDEKFFPWLLLGVLFLLLEFLLLNTRFARIP